MALYPGHDTQRGALDEALQALWATRVLDNWGRKHGHTSPAPILWAAATTNCPEIFRIRIASYQLLDLVFPNRKFDGRTEDLARIAAAEKLVIEDNTINPIPALAFT